MKRLHFTQEQVTKILEEIAQKEGGYQEVLKISLEAMMRTEREEHTPHTPEFYSGPSLREYFFQASPYISEHTNGFHSLKIYRKQPPSIISFLRTSRGRCRSAHYATASNRCRG